VSNLDGHHYGEDRFILASREAKKPYLRLQLQGLEALDARLGAELGPPPGGDIDTWCQWAGAEALARQVAWWALRDGAAVLGSGENASYADMGTGREPWREQVDPSSWAGLVAREDPLGFWSLYSRDSGHRMRLSFGRDASPRVFPFRSTWPELVDVKLTERCARGCVYCSQDSRSDGAHASFEVVQRLLQSLVEAKVFEVVFGGGEPTLHPDFFRILAAAQQVGLKVAFTTRSLKWIPKSEMAVEVRWDDVHWAFSVDTPAEVEAAWEAATQRGRGHFGLSAIHVVLGTPAGEPENLRAIAKACEKRRLALVLLGYKSSGRARGRLPSSSTHWLDVIGSQRHRRVAIDAVLAAESELLLRRRGVPDWLYEVDDGRHSMHVDAVRGRCGPSSYCDERELVDLPEGPKAIRRAFDAINQRLAVSRRERALALEQLDATLQGDEGRLVRIDAALEGRCEMCMSNAGVMAVEELDRPRLLCAACRGT
jgi:hypothetical protein